MSLRKREFKRLFGLVGAVCASLLIGLPAIAQRVDTGTPNRNTTPTNQPGSSDRPSSPSMNQRENPDVNLDRESPDARDNIDSSRDPRCTGNMSEGNMQGDRTSAANTSRMGTQGDRTSAANTNRMGTQGDRTSAANTSRMGNQGDRISAGTMSEAERNLLCTDDRNMNAPNMNRETPGTMRDRNQPTNHSTPSTQPER